MLLDWLLVVYASALVVIWGSLLVWSILLARSESTRAHHHMNPNRDPWKELEQRKGKTWRAGPVIVVLIAVLPVLGILKMLEASSDWLGKRIEGCLNRLAGWLVDGLDTPTGGRV
jgi:hypothetical protein